MNQKIFEEERCPVCYINFHQTEGEPPPPRKIVWGCRHVICLPCAANPLIQSCVSYHAW